MKKSTKNKPKPLVRISTETYENLKEARLRYIQQNNDIVSLVDFTNKVITSGIRVLVP